MSQSSPKPRALYWFALGLLVISVCINYADRGNLGVAAKSISGELHLVPAQLGWLLAAFSITYSLSQLFTGQLIDHGNVNWIYAAGFLLWSAATGLTGAVHGFTAILLLRLLLGFSESVAYPAYSKIIVISFPESLRGTANALIDAGSKLGPALGVLLGVKMIEWFSWRGMFYVIGAGSLLWLIPWCFVTPRLPSAHLPTTESSGRAPSFRQLFSTRAMWGTAIGLFGGNYTWFVFLNWLPYYFETQRHYTHDKLAFLGSLPFWTIAVSSLAFGMLADSLVRRGWHPGRVRQGFACFGMLGCCVFLLPAIGVRDAVIANLLLLLASVSMGAWSSNHWALSQFLSGPQAAGKWTGLQNCIGNFAGVAGQIVSGYALQTTHSFFAAFAIACGILLIGILSYWKVVGAPSPVRWQVEQPQPSLSGPSVLS